MPEADARAEPTRSRAGSGVRGGGFGARLGARVTVLLALLVALAYVVTATRFYAVAIVLGLLALLQTWLVVHLVGRTNRELARFFSAIRYDDLSLTFAIGRLGASFAEFGAAMEEALARFRAARLAAESARRYQEALVEQVPVALLALRDDGTVELLNKAARRLLNAAGKTRIEALAAYGPAFQRDLAASRPGGRTLTRTELDGVERRLVLSTSQVIQGDARERLISIQDIQRELDSKELSAWQDMVRVLSHEINNSLTPIASLARTADEIAEELAAPGVAPSDEAIADLRDAVRTLSRRSDGLLRFVTSYRQLNQMPPPELRPIALAEYFDRLARLVETEWSGRGIVLHRREPTAGLELVADEGLLDQALINLLRNAADAAEGSAEPQVWLSGSVSERGRPVIEVADNGPGFPDEIRDKIFLPFFTTKAAGSGIGLALARQVMLIHNGAITASTRRGGGALFRLTF